jgi:hypothetical protein
VDSQSGALVRWEQAITVLGIVAVALGGVTSGWLIVMVAQQVAR